MTSIYCEGCGRFVPLSEAMRSGEDDWPTYYNVCVECANPPLLQRIRNCVVSAKTTAVVVGLFSYMVLDLSVALWAYEAEKKRTWYSSFLLKKYLRYSVIQKRIRNDKR